MKKKHRLTPGEKLLNGALVEARAERDEFQERNARQAAEIKRLRVNCQRMLVTIEDFRDILKEFAA